MSFRLRKETSRLRLSRFLRFYVKLDGIYVRNINRGAFQCSIFRQ